MGFPTLSVVSKFVLSTGGRESEREWREEERERELELRYRVLYVCRCNSVCWRVGVCMYVRWAGVLCRWRERVCVCERKNKHENDINQTIFSTILLQLGSPFALQ
jgi:hypothetical protein